MPEVPIVLTFGGGLNARQRVSDIQIDECVSPSVNFDLDSQQRALNRRNPFDLIATAPNGGAINGLAQLVDCDCNVDTIIQAGGTIYAWNGDQTFTEVGQVSAGAKLRGPREQNFTLDNYVIVTDLAGAETVKRWDGTTFTDLNHDLGGDLFAKYCRVYNERAWLGNIKTSVSPGSAVVNTPHIILASERGNGEVYSTGERPSSAIGLDSAFFLPTPDLRAVNGLEAAFGEFLISSLRGRLYHLTGSSAFDYEIIEFHVGSAVSGDEAIKNVGNDVVMGLPGRIESLSGTINFGDVESDDLSRWIKPLVSKVTEWTIEYDRRLQKVFCFPEGVSAVYVFYKGLADQELSPWSKWTTTHPMSFNPTAVMQMVDPITLEDRVFFGDSSGQIFRMDGSGDSDGGTNDITITRRSKLFDLPRGDTHTFKGWVNYRKLFDTIVTIRILGGGTAVYEQTITRVLPENTDIGVYNGPHYYGDKKTTYGFELSGRINTQEWEAAGQSSNFQVEVEVTGSSDFNVEEVGLVFEAQE